MPREALRRLRGGRGGMVFQDLMSSLNPVLRVGGEIVEGPARARQRADGQGAGDGRALDRRDGAASAGGGGAPVPAPVLRRYAAADHAGHRLQQHPGPADRRRAHDGARRDDPGADPGPAAPAERRLWHRDHADHARPRRGGQHLQPRVIMYAGKVIETGPVERVVSTPAHSYTQGGSRFVPSSSFRSASPPRAAAPCCAGSWQSTRPMMPSSSSPSASSSTSSNQVSIWTRRARRSGSGRLCSPTGCRGATSAGGFMLESLQLGSNHHQPLGRSHSQRCGWSRRRARPRPCGPLQTGARVRISASRV